MRGATDLLVLQWGPPQLLRHQQLTSGRRVMGARWAAWVALAGIGWMCVGLAATPDARWRHGTLAPTSTQHSSAFASTALYTQAPHPVPLPAQGTWRSSAVTRQELWTPAGMEAILQRAKRSSWTLRSAGHARFVRELQQQEALIHTVLKPTRVTGSGGQQLQHLQQQAGKRVMFVKPLDEADEHREATHSLSGMLMALVRQELRECELVIAYDRGFSNPAILRDVLLLDNVRQVLEVREAEDLLRAVWASPDCRGYLLLLHDPLPLLTFADMHRDAWDYDGKYVVVGGSLPHLLQLTRTDKGRKTQHVVGALQTEEAGEWRLYVNQQYWAKGMLPVTTWRRHSFTSDVDLFPDKLSDLRGALLRVVTFVWEPSIMYRRAEDGSLLERYGVDIDAIALLAHAMNFTVRFDEPPPGELWGRQLDDGSWDGIMGFLDRDEADIGVANMFLSYWRIQVVEFTAPYDLEASCFLARAEPPLPRWQALAFPFQWDTWVAILLGLVMSGPLLHLLAALGSSWGEWRSAGETARLAPSWLYTLGLHLREAQARLPRQPGTQVLVAFLWVYTMILTIAYSTNLTAFLLVKKLPASIETLEQLSQSSLKVAGVGELFMTELQEASDPNVKECFAPNNIVMAVQRRSPLKAKVDQVIDWIREGGFIPHSFRTSLRKASTSKEYINWSSEGEEEEHQGKKKEKQDKGKGNGLIPLNLDHLQGAFILSLAGLIAAALFFMLEMVWTRTSPA
ncbi:glutamate receptor ionotropic, kainate 5-like isoform X2 [Scylla paramamosain]|uniref:glutamate receptor ionotropic, kainate 5-like isoform X2 n=1 Tax=Scylla paramamosain TaxID=85552 RepID=UPI003083AEBD